MRRSWTTILLIASLTGLLVLLGVLQYRWLSQISESEGEKTQKRVEDQAKRFAEDFNREIQGAYFNFQTDSESWKNGGQKDFNERYDYWLGKTAYPDLISDFYFFNNKPDVSPLRFDRSDRSFVPGELSPDLAELRTRFSDEKTFKPIYADSYTLVLPIYDTARKVERILLRTRNPDSALIPKMPQRFGYLVIKLDPATIKEKLLPDLTAKYFGDGEFRAAVTDQAGQEIFQAIKGDTSDVTAPLLDLSPDNFVYFSNKDMMSSFKAENESGIEKHSGVIVNSRVETHSFKRIQATDDNHPKLKIEVKRDETPRTSVFTTTTTTRPDNRPWTLKVQHSSGSLGIYLTNTLRRNLAIGFGLLLLLASAIAAIIISAQRTRMLAQRQVEFVSSVSHEFRTPLAVIYSAGENLADGVAKEDAQVSRYGNLIKGEGKKLTGMVEQILDFAGANSGRRKYNFSSNSVADIVDDALAECRPLIVEKEINIETNVPALLPPVNADRAAISQAIQNLIVNSVKYGNGEKWLRVTAENGGDKVKISVEDRGIGISKSDLLQIFKPFYRSKEVVDAQIHGNGLGLSLVKQIAESHGGRVYATSVSGKGSKFSIELKSEPPA